MDYESEYKKLNKVKYLNYIARVMAKYLQEDADFNLRLIVIYTGDVESADDSLKTACFTLRTEQAFLIHMDGSAELASIRKKLESNEPLADDDLMRLIILPLTIPGTDGKQKMLEEVVDIADQLPSTEQRAFALSGILVVSDKFIQKEFLEQIRRRINMTQIGQMYEKEKIEYANQKVRENSAKEKAETAKSLLADEVDIVVIMRATGLSEEEILNLQSSTVPV